MTNNIWIPFYYTIRVKRDLGFFLKQVLLEELIIILLVFGLFAPSQPLVTCIAITFLFMAMICVYEIGYSDNDRMGELKEDNPKISTAYKALGKFRIAPFAWMWGLVFTGIGIAILPTETKALALDRLPVSAASGEITSHSLLIGLWLCVLVSCLLAFAIFNRVSLKWRVFAYVPLHVTKYFGFALVFVSHQIGLLFLISHIVRTWSLYAVRRAGGDIEFIASQLVRLVFFFLFLGVLSISQGMSDVFGMWQTWVLLGFGIVRAIPEVTKKMF